MVAITLPFFTMLLLEGRSGAASDRSVTVRTAKPRQAALEIEPHLTGRISVA
jgi:hypothetical protein